MPSFMGFAVSVFLSAVYTVFNIKFWLARHFYCRKFCHSISYSKLWPILVTQYLPLFPFVLCIASEWLGWLGGLSCWTCDENYLKLPLSQRHVESSHQTVHAGEIPYWCYSVHILHVHLFSLLKIFPCYLFWLASVILDFFWACWCLSSQVFPLTTSKAFPVFIATMLQPDQMFFQGRSAARQELRQFWPPYFSSNFCATAFGHFIPRGAPFSKVCKVKYTTSSRFTCTALQ